MSHGTSTEPLYRVVYLSRNAIDLPPCQMAVEIDQILATSRRNNRRVGVTGALLFDANHFGQVLEGSHDGVAGVFERIQVDARHDQVELLSFEQVAHRSFPDWSMAYVGADDEALEIFGDLVLEHDGDVTGDRLLQLLLEHVGHPNSRPAR